MSDYKSLARRFRPQVFADVCQQVAVVTTLKNAIALKRVSHAYLFTGPRGVGKTTLARLFAKAINCQNLSSSYEPCNECTSCLEITSGHSLDVLEIDGASNRGIDDIRQLSETVFYTPTTSNYKIYIIDEVHMLTKEAFNALLKTLEEPPKHVKFFFATTEAHKVLPTILSRCQRFDLERISLKHLCDEIKKTATKLHVKIDEASTLTIARCADGSLRDAHSILDQVLCTCSEEITFTEVAHLLGITSKEHFFTIDKAFHEQDLTKAFEIAQTVFEQGKDLSHFLDGLIEHYQTILRLHLLSSIPSSMGAEDQNRYSLIYQFYTQAQALYILDYLIEWSDKFQKVGAKILHLELILLHVIRSKNRINLDELVEKVALLKPDPIEKKELSVANKPATQTIEEALKPEEPAEQNRVQEEQKIESLLRFAAIELNGTLKKP